MNLVKNEVNQRTVTDPDLLEEVEAAALEAAEAVAGKVESRNLL